jgi:iron complex transport system substrate-binding protein
MKFRDLILWSLSLWVIACGPQVEIQDDAPGRLRVATLSPSLTEAVYRLGGLEFLVGRSQYCRHPESVQEIPSLGRIDLPNIERLLALKVDLLLVSELTPLEVQMQVESFGIQVLRFRLETLADILEMYPRVGASLNKEDEAAEIIADLELKRARALSVRSKEANKTPKACFLFSLEQPLFSAGEETYIGSLIELSGFENISAKKLSWPQIDMEWLIQANPDVIFTSKRVSAAAFDAMLEQLQTKPLWSQLSAVQAKRVYGIPQDYFSIPSALTFEALEILSKAWLASPE